MVVAPCAVVHSLHAWVANFYLYADSSHAMQSVKEDVVNRHTMGCMSDDLDGIKQTSWTWPMYLCRMEMVTRVATYNAQVRDVVNHRPCAIRDRVGDCAD